MYGTNYTFQGRCVKFIKKILEFEDVEINSTEVECSIDILEMTNKFCHFMGYQPKRFDWNAWMDFPRGYWDTYKKNWMNSI